MKIGKYLLALRCLNAATILDPDSPKVHEQTVALRDALNKATDLPDKVTEVIKAEFKTLDASTNLVKYNDEFLAKNKESPCHVLAAIRTKRVLGGDKSECDKEIKAVLDLPIADFQDAIHALDTLKRWNSPEVEAFKKAALAKWPDVTRLA